MWTHAFLVVVLSLGACRSGSSLVSLTGVVHNIGTFQEEPQAEPQTTFMLDNPRGIPGLRGPVMVTVPGYVFCGDGMRVRVEGHYLAPGGVLATPILDGARIVKCGF